MARYVSGRAIDGSHAPAGGAHNPLGADGRYRPCRAAAASTGSATSTCATCSPRARSDLSLNVSHLSHRANAAQAGDDIDRLYLIVEYPLKGSL